VISIVRIRECYQRHEFHIHSIDQNVEPTGGHRAIKDDNIPESLLSNLTNFSLYSEIRDSMSISYSVLPICGRWCEDTPEELRPQMPHLLLSLSVFKHRNVHAAMLHITDIAMTIRSMQACLAFSAKSRVLPPPAAKLATLRLHQSCILLLALFDKAILSASVYS
jgi:hypothetical protein